MRNFILLASVTALLVAAFVVFYNRKMVQRVKDHEILRSKTDIAAIVQALRMNEAERVTSASQFLMEMTNAGKLYELLCRTNSGHPFLDSRPAWDHGRTLLDSWGKPFVADIHSNIAASNEAVIEFTIRSFGPNGRDERGSGDDICSESITMRLAQ